MELWIFPVLAAVAVGAAFSLALKLRKTMDTVDDLTGVLSVLAQRVSSEEEELRKLKSRTAALEKAGGRDASRLKDLETGLKETGDRIGREVRAWNAAMGAVDDACDERLRALEKAVDGMREEAEASARQEKRLFEGMSNILNYDLGVARKAVSGDGREDE